MTKPFTAVTNFAVLALAALAVVVATPASRAVLARAMPAAEFAIGTTLVLLAFVQTARAAAAWLARSASVAWLAAALTVALGLFVAGSAQMLDASSRDLNWVALGGIVVGIAGAEWQRRCALR